MKGYQRITEKRETPLVMSQWSGDSDSLRIYNRLVELENKIENGELVGAIWFKSWLNGQICCGRVIGYDDGGFVVESGDDLISAEKIYTSREQAEKDENKTAEDLPF